MASPKTGKAKTKPNAISVGRVLRILGAPLLLGAFGFGAFTYYRFHPAEVTPVIGPAGPSHWAFIESRSFGDLSFVLCASDWPHTLTSPEALGSVIYSEGSNGRAFWSADGSVLVLRKDDQYSAAYDYREHKVLRGHWTDIANLVNSRGGLGPEQATYPDGKGG